MIGRFAGALAAAAPGLIDLLLLTGRKAKKIARLHTAINLAVVTLYAVNIWLRTSYPKNLGVCIGLSVGARQMRHGQSS